MRNPIERLGLPHAWTVALDWFVTIVGAVAIVLAIKAWAVNPYRIPTSSMEPRLHCAAPGPGCLARPGIAPATRSRAASSAGSPFPVRAEQTTTSAPGSSSAASAAARAGSATSALVTATTPRSTPSPCSTAPCSRVWGITPSSAATTMR